MEIIKTCPFCGGEAGITTGWQNTTPPTPMHYVECEECATSAEICKNEEDALKAWNKRI